MDAAFIGETELESGQHNVPSMNPDEKNRHNVMLSTPVLLDPFGSRNSSEHTDHVSTESRCHPQLLRLESWLDMNSLNIEDVRRDSVAAELCQSDAVKQFSILTLQNRDMMEGSWLDNIIWEPQEAVGKPKLILDLQDEQMLFEILDNKDSKHLQLHVGAMTVIRSVKPDSADSFELPGCQHQSDWQFNIANDKFYMNGKISQQLQSNSNKRTAHGIRVHHSAPALKLQTMKLKLSKYCEERPLLLSNAGMGANLCTYYQKSSSSDQTSAVSCNGNGSLGNFLILEPGDKSPFLGDIKAGCIQSSLETNMYRALVFPHKVASTDFLLIRSAKGKISTRRIDKMVVVGQQEPLIEVMSLGSKNLQTYSINRLLMYVHHEFSAAGKRGLPPCIGVDELEAHFPNLSEAIIRKKMKECAFLRRDSKGKQVWYMKRTFNIPSEGDLRRLVSPEHVCAYESILAGLYRLKYFGITQLTLPASISSAMNQLPDKAIALAAASHIERELLITPWNLSSNFVACTNQDRENIERLEITGVGDPSGRGLGFSYVRATASKAPVSNAMVKKKAVAGRGGSTVTGTDADLHRLCMEAAREIFKENKSLRERFVCGACGQFGHMRTNKNCPKYGADPETQLEIGDSEKAKASGKSNSLDPSSQSQLKSLKKKLIYKSATKIAVVEAPEDETPSTKAKVLPVKFKCGSTNNASDKLVLAPTQSPDQLVNTDVQIVNKSTSKANRIFVSNKLKPGETQFESHKPSIVTLPLADVNRGQVESHKPSIVIRPPINTDREQVESHKPYIVLRPQTNADREQVEFHKPYIVIRLPTNKDREQPQKKIVFKQPKEVVDLDRFSQDGATHLEYRKTKKIIELSSFEKCGKQENLQLTNQSAKRKAREGRRLWEEEEKRRNVERLREERERRLYEEEMRVMEEQERFAKIRRYEESIRREREEERQKAKKKKKKKPEIRDEYLEDYSARRNDGRMPERDRSAKRRPVVELGRYGTEHAPPTKRLRGGGDRSVKRFGANCGDPQRKHSCVFLFPETSVKERGS